MPGAWRDTGRMAIRPVSGKDGGQDKSSESAGGKRNKERVDTTDASSQSARRFANRVGGGCMQGYIYNVSIYMPQVHVRTGVKRR
jgi:hypothetical protein